VSLDPSTAKILVVDDEPANVALLERLLRKSGSTNVRSTSDPREGLKLWDTFEPDLLLLDLMMPHLDGFAFMEKIRTSPWMTSAGYVPVLVLTADATARTRDKALGSGAKDFLTKPFDATEVRLRISNLLDTRALHVRLAHANHELEDRVRDRTRALAGSLNELNSAHANLRLSREETIERLSIASEFRDDDTGQHIHRMSRYTTILARLAGYDEEDCALIQMASQMHDVGKIGIPDRVLLKPGKLKPEEREVMERHAEIGHDILSGSESELLRLAARIALSHHERFDGQGYPHGLAGEEIPVEGRIAAISDVFDALTSDRVYRQAFPLMKALQIMKEGRGTQFDPVLLDLFFDSIPEILMVKDHIERAVTA
jgi:putative two-component system response regulator